MRVEIITVLAGVVAWEAKAEVLSAPSVCPTLLNETSCNTGRCKWLDSVCVELNCTSVLAWDYTGDVRITRGQPGASNIYDFTWKHEENCPDLPFASYDYPSEALVGSAPPLDFDRTRNPRWRLKSVSTQPRQPFSVDVAKLTDEQIESMCLTVEDCRIPPQLTVVREADTGNIWKPSRRELRRIFNDKGTYCCDVNRKARKRAFDSNFFTTHRIPPAAQFRARAIGTDVSQEFFPRGSDAKTAKIIKVNFTIRRTRLYIYLDMTCGAAREYYRRNGFLGQWKGRLNGVFHEIVYRTPGRFPSTHGPSRMDLGFTTNQNDYGDVNSNLKLSSFQLGLMGVKRGRRFNWIAVRNIWMYLDRLTPAQMVAAYVKTGIEWTYLSPPKGNMPVALLYFLAAQRLYDAKLSPGTELDFSAVSKYSGPFYTKEKPTLDYLAELQSDGRPRFRQVTLEGSDCIGKLPDSFVNRYIQRGVAPEVGCFEMTRSGGAMTCSKWCTSACSSFWSILQEARALTWDIQSQVPRCSDCPGLMGLFREDVPYFVNSPFEKYAFFPQCLPFKTPEGQVIDDHHVGDPRFSPDYSKCETCQKRPNNCAPTD